MGGMDSCRRSAPLTVTVGVGERRDIRGPERLSIAELTNGLPDGSVVEFDVTADVQAGLGADSTFMTFLVDKHEGGGVASFYSREGAPTLAPQLVITQG